MLSKLTATKGERIVLLETAPLSLTLYLTLALFSYITATVQYHRSFNASKIPWCYQDGRNDSQVHQVRRLKEVEIDVFYFEYMFVQHAIAIAPPVP